MVFLGQNPEKFVKSNKNLHENMRQTMWMSLEYSIFAWNHEFIIIMSSMKLLKLILWFCCGSDINIWEMNQLNQYSYIYKRLILIQVYTLNTAYANIKENWGKVTNFSVKPFEYSAYNKWFDRFAHSDKWKYSY